MPAAPITPYTADLDGREPIAAILETVDTIETLTRGWTPAQFERSYAPGKWSARQILIHLAQAEIAFGSRARLALTTPHYASQNFDQDAWMVRETKVSGAAILAAYVALARVNVSLFAELSAADRQIAFTHPEYGALTIDWILYQTAGHQIHHLKQLQAIA